MRRRPTRRPGVRRSLRVFGDTAAGLDSGGTTPTKIPPEILNARACSKRPPAKIKKQKPPGDTPGREAVLRQNAARALSLDGRMAAVHEDIWRWAGAAEPRKEPAH
jgi:hypothetical protein